MKISTKFILTLISIITISEAKANLTEKEFFNGFESTKYKVYSPENIKPNAPLVLYLHGCTQNADIFFDSTRMKKYADENQFKVLMPIQSALKNPLKCWNWFTNKSTNNFGETKLIIDLLDQVIKDESIDESRVFVAGFSAGAAMSNVLVNCHPEKFSAMAAHDGAAYKAINYFNPFMSIIKGSGLSAEKSANLGYACANKGENYNKAPHQNKIKQVPTILFHSDASKLMPKKYSEASMEQLLKFNDLLDNGVMDNSLNLTKHISNTAKTADGKHPVNRTYLTNASGQIIMGMVLVLDQDHAWSGGDPAYKYNDPNGPDATGEIVEFFKHWGL